MSPQTLNKTTLLAALLCFAIGIGSLASSVVMPLSETEWAVWQTNGTAVHTDFAGASDPQSRSWDYATYTANQTQANLALGSCGFASMDGAQCPLNGFAAVFNWLGLVFLAIGVGAFYRVRTSPNYVCPNA